ncbi:hypothetical protein ES705_23862 [subsurface metagenome]
MKKLLIILMVVAMASFLFVGCIPIIPDPDDPVDPDGPGLYFIGIEVDPIKMDLVVGGFGTIDSVNAIYEFRVYGADVDLGDCLFLTSDSKVATVEKKVEVGDVTTVTVTAEGVGIADILVEYEGKFATLGVTVTAPKSMEIIANDSLIFDVLEAGGFTVSLVANSDVGKKALAYFTLPLETTLWYYEVDPDWLAEPEPGWFPVLVDPATGDVIFGPEGGFPLEDITFDFRAKFTKTGTYPTLVEVWEVKEGGEKVDLLGYKVITIVVDPLLPG